MGHEVYLIVSEWGAHTLSYETGLSPDDLSSDVSATYHENDMSAGLASGSFDLSGMAIVPCSMKTLGGIAHGYSENLIQRAADCCLKERRRLVLVPRETPLSLIHLRNMATVTEAGAIVLPASPAFWHRPATIDELVDSVVDRILVHLGAREQPSISWHDE